jgi:DNA-binding CsgD family transcriptional regulator
MAALSLGFSSLFVLIQLYLQSGIDLLKYLVLLLLLFTLHQVSESFLYYEIRLPRSSTGMILLNLRRSILIIWFVLCSWALFLLVDGRFKFTVPRVKRILFSFLAILTPHLVFSATVARGNAGFWFLGDGEPLLPALICTSALAGVFMLIRVAGRTRGGAMQEKIGRGAAKLLLRGMLAALGTFLLCSTMGLVSALSDRTIPWLPEGLTLTMPGYLVLSTTSLIISLYVSYKGRLQNSVGDHGAFLNRAGISPRELEVVDLVLRGRSNRRIADELFISLSTVKSHLYSVYRKLSIQSRLELVNLVHHEGVRADPHHPVHL